MLLVAGSLNYDVNLYVDHFAPPKSVVKDIKRFLGGSGGNAAVAAARFLGPGKVAMLAAVGDDDIGAMHLEALKNEGIDTSLVNVLKGVESGQAFIAIRPDGENAIYSYYGANSLLGIKNVVDDVRDFMRRAKVVLIMNPPVKVAEELAFMAKELGILVIWDPGTMSRYGIGVLGKLVKLADYIAPNRGELLLMTSSQSLRDSAKSLWGLNKGLVVISKEGKEGVRILYPNMQAYHVSSVSPEALGLKIVSTVGCGDAFVGVFSAMKALGCNDLESAVYATCAASIKASREDPRGSPTHNEMVSKYLNTCSDAVKVIPYRLI
ncbi:MAG: hypothetical protein B6U73_02635 [Desulfurococcales archaeon ex4484_204]|nr:MAG: hypothetical protein B6U73_02635 [Desulfurococcales archaeon ex4484_204]